MPTGRRSLKWMLVDFVGIVLDRLTTIGRLYVEFVFPTCSFIPCRRHKSALSWDPRLSELCTRPPSGIYLACNSIREVIACWWSLCVWCSYCFIITRIFFPAHPSFLSFWSIYPSSLNTLVCNVRIWIKFLVRKIMSRGELACRAGVGFHTKEYQVPTVFEIPN